MSHVDDSLKELSYQTSELNHMWHREHDINHKIEMHDNYIKSEHLLKSLKDTKQSLE